MNIKNQSMHCCMLNKSGTSIWLLAILLMVSGQLFANDINLESAIKLMSERNPSLKVDLAGVSSVRDFSGTPARRSTLIGDVPAGIGIML